VIAPASGHAPAWVAAQLLAIAFGEGDPGQVAVAVGEQPVPGVAG
jgi:hypothetical protein